MVLDELTFDPTSLEGSSSFSVVQGVFVFVSGEIAANNPDDMVVRTPVATLGIRGTKVAGRAAAEGELNTVTMMPEGPGQEVTGTITVSTQTTSVTLNTAYQTTAVSSVFDSPTQPITLSAAQAGGLYGAVSNLLPATASDNAAGPAGTDDAGGGGGGTDDGGGAAGDGQGADAGADGEDGDEGGDGGTESDVAGDGEGAEGEGEELDAAAGDLEGGPDDLGPDGGLADGPAPGQDGFESADGGPTEEEIAAAGFAAANDAFAALEAAIESGESLEDAFDIAAQAGFDALDQYNDAIQEGVFNTLLEGGLDGEFGDPEFFDGGPQEGFDDNPDQFSDEFAGFEGDVEGFEGDFGPQDGEIDPEGFAEDFEGDFGDIAELSPEEAAQLAADFAGEFGDFGGGAFGDPAFGFGGDYLEFGGGLDDFIDDIGGVAAGEGVDEGPTLDEFLDAIENGTINELLGGVFDADLIDELLFGEFDEFGNELFFDDQFFEDDFFEDDFVFFGDEEFFGTQGVSDLSESADPDVLANGLIDSLSGLTITAAAGPGPFVTSASFVGNSTAGAASAGFFESLNFGTADGVSFSLGKGILLTSGDGTPNNANTAIGFTGDASFLSDSDLDTVLSNTGHAQTTTDTTSLEFDFTVTGNVNAIIFDFMFGTDEFNEQAVNDIAAVFVDGTNFALFPDDSILHFDIGSNEFNFFDNTGGALGIEYDGISEPDVIVGLLNTGLSTHTIKIAVSDTQDTSVDTGLFLSAFGLGETFASASAGNDILAGTTGNDSVDAGTGNDSVFGAAGLDTLNGDGGEDKLHGGAGNDILNGGADNDILDGASGNDTLQGGSGNDTLNGGTGDDEITGGTGNDIMSGGTGIDNFTFASTSDGENNAADAVDIIGGGFHNIISDFASGTDKISLTDSNFNLSSLSAGSNFFTIAVQFDGTNTAASGTTPYLVVDSTKTLYFDGNGADGTGYTVMTENTGDAPAITDILLV